MHGCRASYHLFHYSEENLHIALHSYIGGYFTRGSASSEGNSREEAEAEKRQNSLFSSGGEWMQTKFSLTVERWRHCILLRRARGTHRGCNELERVRERTVFSVVIIFLSSFLSLSRTELNNQEAERETKRDDISK
ncbi:hypothetical protein QE152_g1689 [Popillia japonica]|uniref:Uncharacterized protein n=1 Tax=Popillia japonica TaxID=7064 RepID=A0AAW1N5M7_POPJA